MARAQPARHGGSPVYLALFNLIVGCFSFVGIIVPHLVRLLVGPSNRVVLPLSLLVGGGFLVLADLVARTVQSPAELPIGVVTAFFGAPFFLLVLRTRDAGSGV